MTHPLSFIKAIDKALLALEQKPQFAFESPFPFEELVLNLQDIFSPAEFALSHEVKGWKKPEDLYADAAKMRPLELFFAPIKEPLYWLFAETDEKKLFGALLDGEGKESSYFLESSYVEGFYQFFIASALYKIQEAHFISGLSPRIGDFVTDFKTKSSGEEGFFVVETSFKVNEEDFFGELLISSAFRDAWNRHYSKSLKTLPPHLEEQLKEKVSLEVAFEVGNTVLSLRDWEKVEAGDWILLDNCYYDPDEKTGRVVLTLNSSPLFRGKIKDGGIKLFEYPIYEEVAKPMRGKDFEDEDDDLYEDLDDEFEFEDEDEEEEEELEAEEKEEAIEKKEEPKEEPSLKKEVEEEREIKAGTKPSIKAEEIPIEITIEAGRIRMSAKELIQLAPGNLLELNILPERGVDLMVGGKKIGRGELVKLGELLGVRVLEI